MIDKAKLEDALEGLDWPASRQEVWDKAKENAADEETMAALTKIPDMDYENMDMVMENAGVGMESEGEAEDMEENDEMDDDEEDDEE